MFCSRCGLEETDSGGTCRRCGAPLSPGANEKARETPKSQIQSYLVHSVVVASVCCLPTGLIALYYSGKVNSNLAKDRLEQAASASRKAKLWVIITTALGIVVHGILLLCLLATPAYLRAAGHQCQENLVRLKSAKEQFALEHKLSNGTPITNFEVLTPYMDHEPECPFAGVYTINDIGKDPTCSVGTSIPFSSHVVP